MNDKKVASQRVWPNVNRVGQGGIPPLLSLALSLDPEIYVWETSFIFNTTIIHSYGIRVGTAFVHKSHSPTIVQCSF